MNPETAHRHDVVVGVNGSDLALHDDPVEALLRAAEGSRLVALARTARAPVRGPCSGRPVTRCCAAAPLP
jgi:hypothetical protein